MNVPRSKIFDDVYFSAEDGLAETRHVFLDGNGLSEAFKGLGAGHEEFVIAETGFGTGLNFLAVWKLFDEVAAPGAKLHFISVEKYPLSVGEIDAALQYWPELDEYREALVSVYPNDKNSAFRFDFGRVSLMLYFEDVVDGFALETRPVDAWFLDGFRPATNPEMWRDEVFAQISRLSKSGTRFATFTSAGFVRRGLQAVGFEVKKIPGFARKREMSVGVMQ